jgi:hypothetical protein
MVFHLTNFLPRICQAHSQVKKHGKVYFWIWVFLKFLFFNIIFTRRFENLLHQFASHFFSIELNWIWNSIHIQFKVHAVSFTIFIWMELNFNKITFFFRQLMKLLLIVYRRVEPRLMWTKGSGTKYILYTRHCESLGFWIYLKHRVFEVLMHIYYTHF